MIQKHKLLSPFYEKSKYKIKIRRDTFYPHFIFKISPIDASINPHIYNTSNLLIYSL